MNILYISHVPWQWIKQRPHFIAEELSKNYNVSFVYQSSYAGRQNLTKNKVNNNLKLKVFYRLPFLRFNLIKEVNKILFFIYLKILFSNVDIIWFTSPEFSNLIKYIKNKIIIYDCMDDVLEFPIVKENSNELKKQKELEKNLFIISNIIFTSSERLKNKLIDRYGYKNNIYTINNALNLYTKKENYQNIDFNSKLKKIVYIGTISDWFDFELIIESLNKFDSIEYFLFGPTDIKIPEHKRIKYLGIVEHEKINSIMEQSDILIMPFKLNELILSVDPVKVYEYISSKKITILPEYDETKKFAEFCYLYKNKENFFNILHSIINENTNKNVLVTDFIVNNTWEFRTKKIIDHINNFNSIKKK